MIITNPKSLKKNQKLSLAEKVILAILEDHKKGSLNAQQVFLRIPREAGLKKDTIYHSLLSLVQKGLVRQPTKGQFQKAQKSQSIQAKVINNYAGELLLKNTETDEIIRVPSSLLQRFLPEDIIELEFLKQGKRSAFSPPKLISRTPRRVIGVLDIYNGNAFLLTGKSGYKDIKITESPSDKFDGCKAQVEVYDFPENSRFPLGRIIDVFGKPGAHDTEMHAIVAEFGFSTRFPEDVLAESEVISETIDAAEIKRRRDFRSITTFTIDPEDAKDFDDAISLEINDKNEFEIGIHIADVSHYVKEGSSLDQEAIQRATSVYLVDRTIPMLPEKLSNNLCSLRPNEDRLCFSVVLTLDQDYKIINHWIGKGVIHSDKRFSYEQAQIGIISGEGDFGKELITLNTIAQHFEKIRFDRGALRFESKELRFELDEKGLPTKVKEKVRFEAHKMIETFMLLANQTVAVHVHQHSTPPPPFIYRTHDEPPQEKLLDFAKFCKLMGYPIQIENEKVLRKSFNSLLERSAGKPEADLLQQMSIRTMAKAVYTGQKTSHFGLAFAYYTHFTSPIRRYPDLLAHRILFDLLNAKPSTYNSANIEELAKHSSNMEQKASDAERASIKYKLAELMKLHEGEIFEARVTGVTEWGIYATILDYHAEGLIRLTDIRKDQFYFVEDQRKVIGRRTKREYRLGDIISVKVKKANLLARNIDLTLID